LVYDYRAKRVVLSRISLNRETPQRCLILNYLRFRWSQPNRGSIASKLFRAAWRRLAENLGDRKSGGPGKLTVDHF
jgi:hypothetical protein